MGKRFEGDILGPEKILAGHFPPLGRFAEKKKGREKELTSLGSLCLNTNSNSNLFEKILKTYRK
jgi:hypothetical protein